MNRLLTRIFLLSLVVMGSCKKIPENVIKPGQMEEVLYDIHVAESFVDEDATKYRDKSKKMEVLAGVYAENNITKAQFDTSIVYYSKNLEEYLKIYSNVSKRLGMVKDSLVEKLRIYELSLLSPVGDSADVWKLDPQFILGDMDLYTERFTLAGDSNYRANDRMVWSMNPLNIDSVNPLYFSIGYEEKVGKLVQHDTILYAPGVYTYEMNVPLMTTHSKLIGAMTILNVDSAENGELFFIDDISFMRYREVLPDSLANDSISVDSIKEPSMMEQPLDAPRHRALDLN